MRYQVTAHIIDAMGSNRDVGRRYPTKAAAIAKAETLSESPHVASIVVTAQDDNGHWATIAEYDGMYS